MRGRSEMIGREQRMRNLGEERASTSGSGEQQVSVPGHLGAFAGWVMDQHETHASLHGLHSDPDMQKGCQVDGKRYQVRSSSRVGGRSQYEPK